MFKKILQAFIFFSVLQVLVYSCCDDTFNMYYSSIELMALDESDFDPTSIPSEDLILNLRAFYDYIPVSSMNSFKQLTTSAYATSCDEDYILKENVMAINIFSDTNVLDIPSGNSLNAIFSYRNPETLENEPVESIINLLNSQNGFNFPQFDLVLNEAIESELSLSFTIELSMVENNRILEASTATITIE